MAETMAARIEALRVMPVHELREKYREAFEGKEPPSSNKEFLWKRIAYRIQEICMGGISEAARQRIEELKGCVGPRDREAARPQADVPVPTIMPRDRRIPGPGTIIRRAYKGQTVEVKVLEDGYEYRGRVFGSPPLGYDIDFQKKRLVVNGPESVLVREIFDAYIGSKSILKVVRMLNLKGLKTKRRVSKAGKERGGTPFTITTVQHMLANPAYIGKVPWGGQLYSGEHEGILPEEIFKAAEAIRIENRQHRAGPAPSENEGLLRRILRCKVCDCGVIYSYAQRRGRRYHYYICLSAQKKGYDTCPTPSVSAQIMEEAAIGCLRKVAADPAVTPLARMREFFASTWDSLFPAERARIFRMLVERVEHDGRSGALGIRLNRDGIERFGEELAPAATKAAG